MASRVGIVGLGRIGHGFGVGPDGDPLCHSEAFEQIAPGSVRWGLDPDPARRAAFRSRFPAAAVYGSWAEVEAAAQGTEVIAVASPTEEHLDGVRRAVDLGAKTVVCEKPLAQSRERAEELVELTRRAGIPLVLNYTRRFAPLLDVLRAHLEPSRAAVQGVIRYTGGLRHNGTHWIDLCRAVLGEVANVDALGSAGAGSQADPPQSVRLRFEAGAEVTLVGLSGAEYSVGEGELYFPQGVIRFSDGGGTVFHSVAKDSEIWRGFRMLAPPRLLTGDGLRGHFANLARHAIELATTGGTPRCAGEDGLAALKVVELARGRG